MLLDVSVLRTEARVRGIGRYVADLALGLTRADPGDALSVLGLERLPWLGAAHATSDLAGALARLSAAPQEDHLAWAYRLRVGLARAARQLDADLVHTGHPNATPLGKFSCPRVTTCHDLIPLRFPDRYLDWRDGYRAGRERLDYRRYHSADHVIAVSESTASELVTLLGVSARKISVVHNGVDLSRWSHVALGSDSQVRTARGLLDTPYLLYVGAADWRKNYRGMLSALARLKKEGRLGDLVLAWAAQLDTASTERVRALAESLGVAHAVRLLGFVPDAELAALYRGAVAQLFVSLSEGFGYPVVEAMAAGCPVITSDRSSTAEIAGDAAWLVDPEDPAAIAEAIAGLFTDDAGRQRLSALGTARARRFSLEHMAEGTLAVYRHVLSA
ncbi:MAG TPA: glycosyltransferase family 1 protein [Polyangiaceae bacterium]